MFRLKTFLKRKFPSSIIYYLQTRSYLHRIRHGDGDVQIFEEIICENRWQDVESLSGSGSNLRQTERIRQEIPRLLYRVSASSLLDAPCGDFNWMRLVDLGEIRYTGVDVVQPLIDRCEVTFGSASRRFRVANIVNDQLPMADVILCRDGLVHFSYRHISAALRNFRASGCKYLLTTTFTSRKQNWDIVTGQWRPLNVRLQPFNFPPPLELIVEGSTEYNGDFADKSLGLWRLDSLPFV